MLEEEQLDCIRRTWALAAADATRTSQTFYSKLFDQDPTTKPLFVGDLDKQARKLAQTLTFVVDNLDEPDTLLPAVEALALRHVGYKVERDQYTSVGAALIGTLKQLLGAEFGEEDEAAWRDAYGALSSHMIETAYPDA